MGKLIDLTGRRFGTLTVIRRSKNDNFGKPQWICKCDCGKQKIVSGKSLRAGTCKSCGCLNRKKAKELSKIYNKQKYPNHGCKSRLYNIWHGMIQRCNNPKNQAYKYYGGRGIKICDEWKDSFVKFEEWAINNGYRDDLTIDRSNNDSGYNPNNCRWTTKKTQSRNTRTCHMLEYGGEKKTIAEWSEETGINRSTLSKRIKSGWPIDKAIETPVDKRKGNRI